MDRTGLLVVIGLFVDAPPLVTISPCFAFGRDKEFKRTQNFTKYFPRQTTVVCEVDGVGRVHEH